MTRADDGAVACPSCGSALVASGILGGLCAVCLLETAADPASDRGVPRDDGGEPPWQILSVMAATTRGTTYLARGRDREALAVVRVANAPWRPGAHERAAFETRRAALLALRHPTIAAVRDIGQTADGRLFVARDYVAGLPFEEARRRHAPAPDEVARLLALVRDALEAAHAAGLVHGRVCGGNILVSVRAGRATPCLTDFALRFTESVTDDPDSDLQALVAVPSAVGS